MSLLHEERLRGVHPDLVLFCRRLAGLMPFDILVVYGLRTELEQVSLYARGRTEAGDIVTNAVHAEDTPHGRGAAVDLVPMVNGHPDWHAKELYQQMADVCPAYGIKWGGSFHGLADLDHFEIVAWKTLPFPPPKDALP